MVTRLDRLTRSAANLGTLLRMLREREARLIVIDIGLDTGTADGRGVLTPRASSNAR